MFYFFLFCLMGCTLSQQINNESNDNNWGPDSPAPQNLGLPVGAESLVPTIRTSFSCIGHRYGYFADLDNNCQIYHVCHPSIAANGEPVIYQFTKFCPKSTRFDQRLLACLPENDLKLIPCKESLRFYPQTEARLADGQVVQQLGLPETQQRVEPVVVEEPRGEPLPVKGIPINARNQPLVNEGIPVKTVVKNEPSSQPIPQSVLVPVVEQREEPVAQNIPPLVEQRVEPLVEQRAEPLVEQRAEPLVEQRVEVTPIQQQNPVQPVVPEAPIVVRNDKPIQQPSLSIPEPVVSVVAPVKAPVVAPVVARVEAPVVAPVKARMDAPVVAPVEAPVVVPVEAPMAPRSPIKESLAPVANSQTLRTTPEVPPKGYIAPALALRNTESAVPSVVRQPIKISRNSDMNLRPIQYIPQYQPLVHPVPYDVPLHFIQRYLDQNPRVIRPSQYSQYSQFVNRRPILDEQRPYYHIPIQIPPNYPSVPQNLRTNILPNVVRPLQNLLFGSARITNNQQAINV